MSDNPKNDSSLIDLENPVESEGKLGEPESKPEESAEDMITALQTEIATLKDQWLRAVAETENLRRRTEREREDALKYGVTNFARDMLSVADNLERALLACPPKEERSEQLAGLVEGVELVHREIMNSFERNGIAKIFPLHERFDPQYHQAMFEVERADLVPGTIIEVMQPGYIIHGRLLRPALVGVAKGGSNTVDEKV